MLNKEDIFLFLRAFSENMFFYQSHTTKKIIHSFSGGQDSIFLWFLLAHNLKQCNNQYIASYQNHDSQSINIYVEFHFFKLFLLFRLGALNGLMLIDNKSELSFKEYRYDLLIREINYYEFNTVYLSHSHSDLIESKLVEFLNKGICSPFLKSTVSMETNNLFQFWPIAKKKENHSDQKLRFNYPTKFSNPSKKNHRFSGIFRIERPLGSFPRTKILKAQTTIKLPTQNDQTNFDLNYLHNVCRHQILPLFRSHFGNAFEKNFYQKFVDSKDRTQTEKNKTYNKKLNKFFSNRIETIIIDFNEWNNLNEDEISLLLISATFLYKLKISQKEFILIQKNVGYSHICVIRVRYPQILLVSKYLVIRFMK